MYDYVCLPVPMPKGWHIGHRPRGPFSENLFEAMSFTGYTSSGPMRSTENDVCPSNHASTICSLPPIGWRRISQKVGAKKRWESQSEINGKCSTCGRTSRPLSLSLSLGWKTFQYIKMPGESGPRYAEFRVQHCMPMLGPFSP